VRGLSLDSLEGYKKNLSLHRHWRRSWQILQWPWFP